MITSESYIVSWAELCDSSLVLWKSRSVYPAWPVWRAELWARLLHTCQLCNIWVDRDCIPFIHHIINTRAFAPLLCSSDISTHTQHSWHTIYAYNCVMYLIKFIAGMCSCGLLMHLLPFDKISTCYSLKHVRDTVLLHMLRNLSCASWTSCSHQW